MTTAIKNINIIMFSQKMFWSLVLGVVLMVLAYLYCVNAIVWNVAARQQGEKKLSDLTAHIAALESSYMALTSSVNIEHAYTMGFKNTTADQEVFVKRSATLGSLPQKQVQ